MNRRNVIIMLMSIELMLNAVNLSFVAFSRLYGVTGQVFVIFVMAVAAGLFVWSVRGTGEARATVYATLHSLRAHVGDRL